MRSPRQRGLKEESARRPEALRIEREKEGDALFFFFAYSAKFSPRSFALRWRARSFARGLAFHQGSGAKVEPFCASKRRRRRASRGGEGPLLLSEHTSANKPARETPYSIWSEPASYRGGGIKYTMVAVLSPRHTFLSLRGSEIEGLKGFAYAKSPSLSLPRQISDCIPSKKALTMTMNEKPFVFFFKLPRG